MATFSAYQLCLPGMIPLPFNIENSFKIESTADQIALQPEVFRGFEIKMSRKYENKCGHNYFSLTVSFQKNSLGTRRSRFKEIKSRISK